MITFFNGRRRGLGEVGPSVYAQIDVAFRDYLYLLRGAKLAVLLAIALHANEDGWAWPSYSVLAQETGYSEDTIRQALRELCALEINGQRVLLRYQPRAGGDRTFESNRYLIFPSPEEVEQYEGAGTKHLGAESGGGFRRISQAQRQESPSWSFPTTEKFGGGPSWGFSVTEKPHDEQEPSIGIFMEPEPLEELYDDDDDKRAAEINQTALQQILRAVWEGAVGRSASPEEVAELEALVEFCPPTKLLALIPNLALRVGPQNLTLSLLRAAALGELSIAGLDAAMPAPPSIPEPAPAPPAPPSSDRWGGDPVLAEVVAMYEQEIGPITQMVAEELKAMTEEVRDLARWREAFRAAVAANVRRWSYVRACLRGDGRGRPPAVPVPARGRAVRARVVRPEDMPPMPDEEPLPPPD